ncbi:MAG TPA: tRNA (N6-threonylcarbamoyladenosine(37)-N6)-methyltransferase TrmO [Salinisphaeraceae bacterium]|nr:tRNA (N6-threonylcarbamoyladenosine(37)-N6)-methyltransferase TrmO [Salinisphaeraceae bacterium]
MAEQQYSIHPIGWVESSLAAADQAPDQEDHAGAPAAWLVFAPSVRAGLRDLRIGQEILLLTWFDRARRDVFVVHPHGDPANPETGVFSTRSPNRPNPIALHRVKITATDGLRVQVAALEALDATPIVDIKPVK